MPGIDHVECAIQVPIMVQIVENYGRIYALDFVQSELLPYV